MLPGSCSVHRTRFSQGMLLVQCQWWSLLRMMTDSVSDNVAGWKNSHAVNVLLLIPSKHY